MDQHKFLIEFYDNQNERRSFSYWIHDAKTHETVTAGLIKNNTRDAEHTPEKRGLHVKESRMIFAQY
jgi:hypothetical protein